MSYKLSHFIEWKKIPSAPDDGLIDTTMGEFAAAGATDLVAHPLWGSEEGAHPGYFRAISAILAKHGIRCSGAHAFWGGENDLASRNFPLAKHEAFLAFLEGIGVKTYTIHLGLENPGSGSWREISLNLSHMLPAARRHRITVALENGRESVADLRRLADMAAELRAENVGICFDTGHANCYSPLGFAATMRLLAPDIVSCHMHDNHGTHDDHNPPGDGNLPWEIFTAQLTACPRLHHLETESGDWSIPAWHKFRDLLQ